MQEVSSGSTAKGATVFFLLILLGGCTRASVPNLEDLPPTAQASAETPAPGGTKPDELSANTQAPGGTKADALAPNASAQAPGGSKADALAPNAKAQAPDERAREIASSTVSVELTPEQRRDIEKSVKRDLPEPRSAVFGSMAAKISRFTTQSYIVCGWVDPGNGNQPFVAMYVPKMRSALLIGMGGRQPQESILQRCEAEGVPLNS